MLDVHPAHHAATTWREFLIHIATIVLGLLIAVSLEQAVEYVHHRHQVTETREALRDERRQNISTMPARLAEFRLRINVMQTNLAVFHFFEQHPGSASPVPGPVNWHSTGSPFVQSVWTTAQQGNVLALMPPKEVRENSRQYRLLQICSDSFAAYRVANSEARAYTVDAVSPAALSPQQIQDQIRLTRAVLNRLYRYGSDLRNLSLLYPEFTPAPSIEELSRIVHEPASERQAIESTMDPTLFVDKTDSAPAEH